MDGLAYSIPHPVEQCPNHHYLFDFQYSTLAKDAIRTSLAFFHCHVMLINNFVKIFEH